MGYLLLWLFFGLVSAIVAGNKNRSSGLWFLLGVLFGPFAFIVVLVLSKIENKEDSVQSKPVSKQLRGSYYYEIKVKSIFNEWDKVKKEIFAVLGGKYKIKQNDSDRLELMLDDDSFIEMTKDSREDGEYIIVKSTNSGNINFSSFGDALIIDKCIDSIEKPRKEESNISIADELKKLNDLKEQGILTEEEFFTQKIKLLS